MGINVDHSKQFIKTSILIIGSIVFTIGCGQGDKPSNPPPVAQPICTPGQPNYGTYGCNGNAQTPYSCPVGQVFIANAGCVAQGNCPANYGFYNNNCTAGTIAATPTGGVGYQYGAGACALGQVYTYYGCLPNQGCPLNQGYYANGISTGQQCVPALTIGGNGNTSGYGTGYGYSGGYSGYGNGNYGYGNYYPYSSYYYGYGYQRPTPYFGFYLRF